MSTSKNKALVVRLSQHAIERAKERRNWNFNTLLRMTFKAIEKGIQTSEATGDLRDYMKAHASRYNKGSDCRIYSQTVFIIAREKIRKESPVHYLVTVMHLPKEHQRAVSDIVALRSLVPLKCAADMIECDCCGEPFCRQHEAHFADCPCVGIHEAEDKGYEVVEFHGKSYGRKKNP